MALPFSSCYPYVSKFQEIVMTLPLILALLLTGGAPQTMSENGNFVFCHATSISPRARGLIVSPVFDARTSSTAWLRQSFSGFLRASYAPYGNNWQYSDATVECASYIDRREAQVARDALILVEQRRDSNIFYVSFVG